MSLVKRLNLRGDLFDSIPSGSSNNAYIHLIIGGETNQERNLVKDFLWARTIPHVRVLCPRQKDADFYVSSIPRKEIREWNDKELEEVILSQNIRCRMKHERKIQMDERSLLFFDECVTPYWVNQKHINRLISCARGHAQSCVFVHRAYEERMTHSTVRSNVNFVYLFHEPRWEQRRWLYDDFAHPLFFTFDMFCHFMDQYATTTTCLVLRIHPVYKKEVYWYRINPHWDIMRELNDVYFHPHHFSTIQTHQHN